MDENSSSDEECIPFPENKLLRQERNPSNTLEIVPNSTAQNDPTVESPSCYEGTSKP
ncbi:hypothetical protein HI914_00106 [Erysiphe necator]|nr:hypothetical protein HI914_00106 [Erysiphe necator]